MLLKSRINHASGREAFSLLEFLIAIAILTILMSVAFSPLQKLLVSYQQKIFFNQLILDIDQLRDQVRLDHRDRQIDFLNDHYEIKLATQIEKKKNYPKTLILKSSISLAFAVTGIPKKSGTITFWDEHGKVYKMILAPVTGRVRLEVL